MTYSVTVNSNAGYSIGISSPTISFTQTANGAYVISQSNVSYNTSIGSTTYSLTTSGVGMQGDVGYAGSSGALGYTGSVGFVGSRGATGFTGSFGATGFTGSRGATGFTGSVGFVGSRGATGFTGSSGAVIVPGSTGQLIYNNNGTGAGTGELIFDNTSNSLQFSSTFALDAASTTLSTTTETAIATFSASTYGGGKFTVLATSGSNRHIVEMLVTHNGTVAHATEYGIVSTASPLASYNVDISSGNVRVLAQPASASSTAFKVVAALLLA